MESVTQLASAGVPVTKACRELRVSRASFYRREKKRAPIVTVRRPSHRALTPQQRAEVLEVLNSKRFADSAPAQVYATLLEEGKYYCSIRTMYRILAANNAVRERRNQRKHPKFAAPDLTATAPNQVWTWDITKLKSTTRCTCYYLYVILDMYSRCVVGWMIADREDSKLAEQLIAKTCERQNIQPKQLALHADRGPSMTSKLVADLLVDLGIKRSHSRPRVSNDNAYSEAQFKTLKYHRDFPQRFASLADARFFLSSFFDWYNHNHKHSGIGHYAPADVHSGRYKTLHLKRQSTLDAAHKMYPERFGHPPKSTLPKPARLGPYETTVIELERQTDGQKEAA